MDESIELLFITTLFAIIIPLSFIINTKIEQWIERDSFSFVWIDNNVSLWIYDSEEKDEMNSTKNIIYVKGNIPYQCNNWIWIECLWEIKNIWGIYNGKSF